MIRASLISLCALIFGGIPSAQTSPSFEVASVRPGAPGDGNSFIQLQQGGRVIVRNIPLLQLITWTYQLRQNDERLTGIPDWIRTEKFTIDAKAPEGVVALGSINPVGAPGPGLLMLRTLLAERFQLAMHTETRELPIYHLVTAHADGRFGPKLTRADFECPALGAPLTAPDGTRRCTFLLGLNRVVFRNQPIAQLADYVSGRMRRLVVDRTGLAGRFDFEMTWTPDQAPPADAPDRITVGGVEIDLTGGAPYDPNGPAFLTALREQLGLKLESTRGPVEVYVIDRVERPTPD